MTTAELIEKLERAVNKAPATSFVIFSLVGGAALAGWAFVCSQAFESGFISAMAFFCPAVVFAITRDISAALKAKEADNA